MWLRDGLPQHLKKTRIMIYGHNTSLYRSASFADMIDHGKTLLQCIKLARPEIVRIVKTSRLSYIDFVG